jgi:hypothetical protein
MQTKANKLLSYLRMGVSGLANVNRLEFISGHLSVKLPPFHVRVCYRILTLYFWLPLCGSDSETPIHIRHIKKNCVSLWDLTATALSIKLPVKNVWIFLISLTSFFQRNLAIINTSARKPSARVTVWCNEGCFHFHKTQFQIFSAISNCRILF